MTSTSDAPARDRVTANLPALDFDETQAFHAAPGFRTAALVDPNGSLLRCPAPPT